MDSSVQSKLLGYQINHVNNLIYSLKTYGRALDASDTGTGKTYCAIALALTLKLKPFIICPKSVISSWLDVIKYFNADYYGISNYELIQNCRHYTAASGNEKVSCPYLTRLKKDNAKTKKRAEYLYKWTLPKDALIIFDEAHRCKNKKTINSDILKTISNTTSKIILLSATIADKPQNFSLAGYVLGLYPSMRHANNWINNVGMGYSNVMEGVHERIFNEYGSRMKIRDLGDMFPQNQVLAECFDMDAAEEIEKQYKIIEEEVEKLKKQEEHSTGIAQIMKARQKIEMLKVPTFIELAKKYIEEGLAVAIFVNFTATLMTIAEQLKTNCLVYGEQTIDERINNIDDFNSDKSNIIICNIRAGGVGISLHDKNGVYPRISIISPSWSAQDIIQALGRIHRAKGKTTVRQRIVYCKKTIEEYICKNMKQKIVNIGSLNDGDTKSYEIEGLITGSSGSADKMTEFERVFQKISVLHMKKDRLQNDLTETENEIKSLELILQNYV